jgi:hypothetical protein
MLPISHASTDDETTDILPLSFNSCTQHKLNAEIAELEVRAADRRAATLKREEEARREAEEALNVDGSADGEGVSVSVALGLEAVDVSMEGITV